MRNDRYAKGGVVVEHGDAGLELSDLLIEISRHQRLTQTFDAVRCGFDAAVSVMAAPVFPDGSTRGG